MLNQASAPARRCAGGPSPLGKRESRCLRRLLALIDDLDRRISLTQEFIPVDASHVIVRINRPRLLCAHLYQRSSKFLHALVPRFPLGAVIFDWLPW